MAETLLIAFAEDKFGAAAAHVDDQQRRAAKYRVGDDTAKRPFRLLFAGNDFDRNSGGIPEGGQQVVLIERVPRGAGGNDANGDHFQGARSGGKFRHDPSRVRDGGRPQPSGLVESAAQPCLLALFEQRLDLASGYLGHQQFYGIGADINDGSADGIHRCEGYASGRACQS